MSEDRASSLEGGTLAGGATSKRSFAGRQLGRTLMRSANWPISVWRPLFVLSALAACTGGEGASDAAEVNDGSSIEVNDGSSIDGAESSQATVIFEGAPFGFAADETDLFLAAEPFRDELENPIDGRLIRMWHDGSQVTELSTQVDGAGQIGVTADDVYYTTPSGIYRQSKSVSMTPERITNPGRFALSSTHFVHIETDPESDLQTVLARPLDGAEDVSLFAESTPGFWDLQIAACDDQVFFFGIEELYSVPIDGSAAPQLVSGSENLFAARMDLLCDSDALYFATEGYTDNVAVRRFDLGSQTWANLLVEEDSHLHSCTDAGSTLVCAINQEIYSVAKLPNPDHVLLASLEHTLTSYPSVSAFAISGLLFWSERQFPDYWLYSDPLP